MASKTTYFCDRCGQEGDCVGWFDLRRRWSMGTTEESYNSWQLCKACGERAMAPDGPPVDKVRNGV